MEPKQLGPTVCTLTSNCLICSPTPFAWFFSSDCFTCVICSLTLSCSDQLLALTWWHTYNCLPFDRSIWNCPRWSVIWICPMFISGKEVRKRSTLFTSVGTFKWKVRYIRWRYISITVYFIHSRPLAHLWLLPIAWVSLLGRATICKRKWEENSGFLR